MCPQTCFFPSLGLTFSIFETGEGSEKELMKPEIGKEGFLGTEDEWQRVARRVSHGEMSSSSPGRQ